MGLPAIVLRFMTGALRRFVSLAMLPLLMHLTRWILDLAVPKRNSLKSIMDGFGASYEYDNQGDSLITVPALDTSGLNSMTLRQVKSLLLDYFEHGKPTGAVLDTFDSNTEFLDDFSTDPLTSRMSETGISGGTQWSYNATDDDMDITQLSWECLRYDSSVGSSDMETQCSFESANNNGWPGPTTRVAAAAATSYEHMVHTGGTGNLYYGRRITGTQTIFDINAFALTDSVWHTLRAAVEGTGATVSIDTWVQIHTSSKPSDPGWIGSDGSPDNESSDSHADRIVTNNMGGMVNNRDVDRRFDWFKTRAVSDRSVGGLSIPVAMANYRRLRV